MYCPSCDKSYGAVHSRCPECHSWLKVSAPSNHRSKNAKTASSSAASGAVSTLDKEPAWSQEPSDTPSAWGPGSGADSAIQSFPTLDPAPASPGAWGGKAGWGDDPSSSGEAGWSAAKIPTSSPLSPAPSSGGGWLGGSDEESDDGWSGGGLKPPASAAPTPLADKPIDGWSSSGSPAPISGPALQDDDWGSSGIPTPASKATSLGGGGWLGGSDEPPLTGSTATSAGWLSGGSPATHSESNDGWLNGGEESSRAPSMTEMVDHAIDVEEGDDFVDESWVDEEINSEFDDLEVPDYTPPSPEVGTAFLKMLLVAAMVLLVGGGLMFMGKEEKTPEQIKAEERAKELDFARSSALAGSNYLKEGKPLLAVGPLTAAMTSLKTSGASEDEVWAAKAELARALMKTQDYEKSHEHWAGLVKGPEQYRKEAVAARDEVSRLLRAQANAELADTARYFQMGESSSLLLAGEKALKIYENYGGTASQKGRAIGVIGRGYLNGKEYGKARDHLQKARKLNPGGGYDADLREIAARTQPVDYHAGGIYYQGGAEAQPVAAPQTVYVNPSIGGDSDYAKAQRTYSASTRRSSATQTQAPVAAPAPPPRPRVQQPSPPPRRSTPPSSGGRKGARDVLPTY